MVIRITNADAITRISVIAMVLAALVLLTMCQIVSAHNLADNLKKGASSNHAITTTTTTIVANSQSQASKESQLLAIYRQVTNEKLSLQFSGSMPVYAKQHTNNLGDIKQTEKASQKGGSALFNSQAATLSANLGASFNNSSGERRQILLHELQVQQQLLAQAQSKLTALQRQPEAHITQQLGRGQIAASLPPQDLTVQQLEGDIHEYQQSIVELKKSLGIQ